MLDAPNDDRVSNCLDLRMDSPRCRSRATRLPGTTRCTARFAAAAAAAVTITVPQLSAERMTFYQVEIGGRAKPGIGGSTRI